MYPLANPTHSRVAYMDGNAGILQTAALMRRIVAEYKAHPEIRSLAMSLLTFVPEKDELQEIESLFNFVRDNIRYTRDISGIETLSTPDQTLLIGQGDCDDQSVLLASLLESVGYPTAFQLTGYNGGNFEHVYVLVCAANQWLALDPTENNSVGWQPPNPTVQQTVF